MLYLRTEDEKNDAVDVISKLLAQSHQLSSTAFRDFGKGVYEFLRNIDRTLKNDLHVDDKLYTSTNPLLDACVEFWTSHLENKYRTFYPLLSNHLDSRMTGVIDDIFTDWLQDRKNTDQRPTVVNVLLWMKELLLTAQTDNYETSRQMYTSFQEIINVIDLLRRLRNAAVHSEEVTIPTSLLRFLEDIRGLVFSLEYILQHPVVYTRKSNNASPRIMLYSMLQNKGIQLYCGVSDLGGMQFEANRCELVRTKGRERVETLADLLYLHPEYKHDKCDKGPLCSASVSCAAFHSESEQDFINFLMSLYDISFFRSLNAALVKEAKQRSLYALNSGQDLDREVPNIEYDSRTTPLKMNGNDTSSSNDSSAFMVSESGGTGLTVNPQNNKICTRGVIDPQDIVAKVSTFYNLKKKFCKLVTYDTAKHRTKNTKVAGQFFNFCIFLMDCSLDNCTKLHRLPDMLLVNPNFKALECTRQRCVQQSGNQLDSFQPLFCNFYHSEREWKLIADYRQDLGLKDSQWRVHFSPSTTTLGEFIPQVKK